MMVTRAVSGPLKGSSSALTSTRGSFGIGKRYFDIISSFLRSSI